MPPRVLLVHYHEIGLKGKNRSTFENRLVENLSSALSGMHVSSVSRTSGHILVRFSDQSCVEAAAELARQIPGVARVSRAFLCERDERQWCEAAVAALSEFGEFESFKVHARRSSTDYHLHTLDINRIAGEALCQAFPDKRVQMHGPDATVYVYVVQSDVFVYARSEVGVGGLPVGTAGKVVSLFSSGFDSPVASWMVGRRGANVVPVHFSGRPMTSDESEWLCQDIVRTLKPAGIIGRLYVVPFGDVQRRVSLVVPQSLRIIMYRRLMFAVAQELARIEGAKAIVTGESLGQVASQTLENIAAVDEMAKIPVFRPLIGSDKQEILERSRELGLYDLCSQTAPDCCTLFMPRKPETHARLDQVHEAWELFDHEAFIEELLDTIEYIDVPGCPSYKAPSAFRARHTSLSPRES